MADRTRLNKIALGPNHGMTKLKEFTGSNLGFDKSDRRIPLEKVPTQLPDGRYVHVTHILAVINVDVDSDGTPNADLAAERILQSFSNLRMSYLGGEVPIYEGGQEMDLRVPSFIQKAIRDQRVHPALPSDAGASSAADIFSSDVKVLIPVGATGYNAEGRSRRDGMVFRGLFTDVGGADDLLLDVLAASAGLGAVSGVTLQNVDKLEFWSVEQYDKFINIDGLWRLDYQVSDEKEDTVRPIDQLARAYRTEYVGFRQQDEDPEGLDFSNAGNITVRHGQETRFSAKNMTEYGYAWGHLGYHISRPTVSDRYAPVTGHLPLVWAGGVANRDQMGRSPVTYKLTSLGSSRTEVRVLRSEVTSWHDNALALAAEQIGVSPDRLRGAAENVDTVHISPELLPTRVQMGGR